MAILVTGGTGFVGLNLVEALLARGDSVVILSNGPLPEMAEPAFARLPGRLTMIAGDVRDARLVGDAVRRHGIERIVAYVTFVDEFGAAWDDALVARWSAKPLCMLWLPRAQALQHGFERRHHQPPLGARSAPPDGRAPPCACPWPRRRARHDRRAGSRKGAARAP